MEILESAANISYIGAGKECIVAIQHTRYMGIHLQYTGIQVTPNSSKILRKLGIDLYIEKYCTNPVDLRMMRWEDGQILVECPLKEPAENDYLSPYWLVIVLRPYSWTNRK